MAEEIDLQHAEGIVRHRVGDSRVRISRRGPEAIIIRNAPIRIQLGDLELTLAGQKHRAEVIATIWDYGAVSICFQVPIGDFPSAGLAPVAADITSNPQRMNQLDELARTKSRELVALLLPALKKPNESNIFEDYVIYFFEKVDGIATAAEIAQKVDLPVLILGETQEPLAPETRASILENIYQYSTNDFVLIDWNSAVIVEPNGQRDTVDVLEFALTHLLEVRYYDGLLDQRMTQIYDSIEASRRKTWNRKFDRLSKDANILYVEFSEFMERIDNSFKVVGDFYLARLFRGAVRRFRIPDWQQNITRKLNLLARVSDLLMGEVNVRRSHYLEAIIIFLILFEILSAMFKSGGGH
ncbi:MAG: hypothetical protein AB7P04_00905 [Bacteriovoracia bacterium]